MVTRIREQKETAGIVIKLFGEEDSFQRVLKKARERIAIKKLGINEVKTKRTARGPFLMEIRETESGTKANCLTKKLNEVLEGEATARRTSRFAEMKRV